MGQRPEDTNPFDPFRQWRAMRDQYMDAWSKAMIDLTTSEEYAQAQARMLDSYLTVSAPFRKSLESVMSQVLAQLNMPTRSDVTNLAERLTNIETRLDDMDAKLDDLEQARAEKPATRTRKGEQ